MSNAIGLFNFHWYIFFSHWMKDAKLWIILMAMLSAFRVFMITYYHNYLGAEASFYDIILCIFAGMKFDARFALLGVTPTLILSLFATSTHNALWLHNFRILYGQFVVGLTLLVLIVDCVFFYEYHDHFNHWIFGVIFDDQAAILQTAWNAFPILLLLALLIASLFLTRFLLNKFLQTPLVRFRSIERMKYPVFAKILTTLLMIFIIKCGITCTLGWNSLSRKDTAVTGDMFLNKMVYNPYYALYSTVKDYRKLNSGRGIEFYLPNTNILSALQTLYPEKNVNSNSIEDWIHHEVKKPLVEKKPKHIFLVIMESQDNWPLLEKYEQLGLNPNLKRFSDKGIHVRSFISAGTGTMPALNSIIMGLPEVGIETQYQAIAKKPLSTSIAEQFKTLGYKTNLFYGGLLSWRKLGELAHNQGFDNIYGSGNIKVDLENEWGVNDAELFKFVENKVKEEKEPTFNLIMTTSNHPPHSIDVKKEGFPHEKFPEAITQYLDKTAELNILAHVWYTDRCLGDFVDNFEKDYPDTLFVFTGDHWSRRFLNRIPTLYEKKSVPLIIYGPEVLKLDEVKTREIAGSHLDIAPTIIELIAPEAHAYKSLGKNLFDPKVIKAGMDSDIVITPRTIWEAADVTTVEALPWYEKEWNDGKDVKKEDLQILSNHYNALHGVGWWRIKKGSEF